MFTGSVTVVRPPMRQWSPTLADPDTMKPPVRMTWLPIRQLWEMWQKLSILVPRPIREIASQA
jgi:hypothetical protein